MSEKVLLQSENFKVVEQRDEQGDIDSVTIEGVAVPYERESRNGVIYSEDSIKEAADTLEGRPFLFNHDPDQVMGHVTEAKPQDNALGFEASLNPEKEKVKDIQRGDVRTVSIQAMVEEAEEGDDNRVHVEEFLELSSAPIPGFDMAQATVGENVVRVEEFKEQRDTVIIREPEGIDGTTEVRWDPQDVEDFQSKEAYFNAHTVWYRDNPQSMEDVSFEVARVEDGDLLISYEGLNSAYDLAETSDDLGVDDVNSLRSTLEDLRETWFPDREPLDADNSDEEGMESPEGEQQMTDETEEETEESPEPEESEESPEEESPSEEQADIEQKLDRVLNLLEDLVGEQDDDEEEPEDDDEEEASSDEESVEPSKQPAGSGGTTGNEPTINDITEQFRAAARGGE